MIHPGSWSIIPFSKWLITMVSKSPNWGCSLSKWPKRLVNGGYYLLTNWDDPPSTTPPSTVPFLKNIPNPTHNCWSFCCPPFVPRFFAAKVTFHPPRSENRSVPRWYLQTIASVQWQRCRWRTSLGRSVFGSKKVWKAMAFCHLSKNGKNKVAFRQKPKWQIVTIFCFSLRNILLTFRFQISHTPLVATRVLLVEAIGVCFFNHPGGQEGGKYSI